jgi:hypothetical protein
VELEQLHKDLMAQTVATLMLAVAVVALVALAQLHSLQIAVVMAAQV